MASSNITLTKLLFKTDLGGQLVRHKLTAATNTRRQNLYF